MPGFYEIARQKSSTLVDDTVAALEPKFVNRFVGKPIDKNIPNCRIVDLSRHGIRIELLDTMPVGKGDVLRVQFCLDNSARTEIKQECEVRHITDRYAGCRMLKDNVSIGFYLIG